MNTAQLDTLFSNLEFGWPLLALALPLPWLLRHGLRPVAQHDDSLWLPILADYEQVATTLDRKRRRWPLWLALFTWSLLVLAGTRPLWVSEPRNLPLSGRDLMLAVDLSESMRQTDFELKSEVVDRLAATKAVAQGFISERSGDRIGLIVFGTRAYVQAPLTLDHETIRILLDETAIGLAGGKTAIGDAIGLAVKRLRGDALSQRVLILMTDGANTAGEVDPLVAARLAAASNLKIYTIGIGSERAMAENLSMTQPGGAYGLDEQTLIRIAETTDGRYFRADDTETLAAIYTEIDVLEPVEIDSDALRQRTELYPWPLALALIIMLLSLTGARLRGRRER